MEVFQVKKHCVIFLGLTVLTVCAFPKEGTTEVSGPLEVSENGRFLVRPDGTPIFPLADTAWALTWKLNREEVERYLQHRKDQKFNIIALVAFPSYDGAKILPNSYEDYPFEVEDEIWNPGKPLLTPGADPNDAGQYDYWDHLEYILDTAASKDLYVILLPAWGCYVAGSYVKGEPTKESIFDATGAYEYGNWIGQRFADKNNLLWMIGGDRSAVYGERDYREVFRAMAEGVADGVAGVHQRDSKADYESVLMSYHPRKWHPNSSEWFHHDPWLDFNSIQDQPKDQIVAIEKDYSLVPPKPTWLFEGGYEMRHRGGESYTDWQVRFQSYQTVFAGGFGVTYGSMNVFHFDNGFSGLDEPVVAGQVRKWEAALDEEGAVDMTHLHDLMTSVSDEQFLDRIPDRALIDSEQGSMTGTEGAFSDCMVATRGARGDYALVYSANGRNLRLRMDRLAGPAMRAFWFDPRTGEWRVGDTESDQPTPFAEEVSSGPGAPVWEADPPGEPVEGNDWVLVLKAQQ
jgi:hypothetical protein